MLVSKKDIYYSGEKHLLPKGSQLEKCYLVSSGSIGYSYIQYSFDFMGMPYCPWISNKKAKELGVI